MKHESGLDLSNFYDDNFTLHRARVVERICNEILRRGLQISWKCEGRVDGVDLELLTLMKKAGCITVAYGVESGNPDSLALFEKRRVNRKANARLRIQEKQDFVLWPT